MNNTSGLEQGCSYESSVAARAQGNTCLQNLVTFLRTHKNSQYACRVACLEFSSTDKPLRRRNLALTDLISLLNDKAEGTGNIRGRLLIVEDLSSEIIKTLGCLLKINPLFFASHIDTFQEDITAMRPWASVLPSTARSQNFLNLPYHRCLELRLEDLLNKDGLLRDMNVPRKVAILPRLKGVDIGIARHCCSILKTQSKDGLWLGLILIDPPISNSYQSRPSIDGFMRSCKLQTRLFKGGFQDFIATPILRELVAPDFSLVKSSPLESLISLWGIKNAPGFDKQSPSLLSLSSYPLRMIAAEWLVYVELMYHSVKKYEYSSNTALAAVEQIDVLSADIHALNQWARRRISSKNKIRHVIEYLDYCTKIADHADHATELLEDYQHIAQDIDTYGHRLEALVATATSLVQTIDCRRSLTETVNISRLTYLALSFIPLTFVSGLFSMNDHIAPGGRLFGLYFAVSIPLCFLVFLFMHLPSSISVVAVVRNWWSRVIR